MTEHTPHSKPDAALIRESLISMQNMPEALHEFDRLVEQLEALQQENFSLRGELANWQAAWRREETAKLEAVANSNPASESERVKGEGGTRGLATQEGKPVSDSQPPPVSRSESPAQSPAKRLDS